MTVLAAPTAAEKGFAADAGTVNAANAPAGETASTGAVVADNTVLDVVDRLTYGRHCRPCDHHSAAAAVHHQRSLTDKVFPSADRCHFPETPIVAAA